MSDLEVDLDGLAAFAGRLDRRVVLMQTFVLLPARNRVVIVSCSSPVLPIADAWFDV